MLRYLVYMAQVLSVKPEANIRLALVSRPTRLSSLHVLVALVLIHSIIQQSGVATIWACGDNLSLISPFPWGCGINPTYPWLSILSRNLIPYSHLPIPGAMGSGDVPRPLAHPTTSYLVPPGLPVFHPIFGGSYNI